MQLEEILDIAEETFRTQIAKAGMHPEYHKQFFQHRWSSVVAHVKVQCSDNAEITKPMVERCVRRQWTLKKVRAALEKMASASQPKRSSTTRSEHRGGWSGPARVVWAQKGGTGCLPVA